MLKTTRSSLLYLILATGCGAYTTGKDAEQDRRIREIQKKDQEQDYRLLALEQLTNAMSEMVGTFPTSEGLTTSLDKITSEQAILYTTMMEGLAAIRAEVEDNIEQAKLDILEGEIYDHPTITEIQNQVGDIKKLLATMSTDITVLQTKVCSVVAMDNYEVLVVKPSAKRRGIPDVAKVAISVPKVECGK